MTEELELLKKYKKSIKMTNKELAEKTGIPLGTINKILSGETKSVKFEIIQKISDGLGYVVDINENLNYGYIRCASAVPKTYIANVEKNVKEMKNYIYKAHSKNVNILVFPELSLTSASCGDLFFQKTLLNRAIKGLDEIINISVDLNMIIIVGLPMLFNNNLYDVAAIIYDGDLLGLVPRNSFSKMSFLHRYFSEYRGDSTCYQKTSEISIPFGSDLVFKNSKLLDFSFLCEVGSPFDKEHSSLFNSCNSDINIVCNLASITGELLENDLAINNFKAISNIEKVGYVISSCGKTESTTDYVYPGFSYIFEDGSILNEGLLFNNSMVIGDVDVSYLSSIKTNTTINKLYPVMFDMDIVNNDLYRIVYKNPFTKDTPADWSYIISLQAYALAKRFEHSRSKKLILGISGGLDSTLALLVCAKAMDILSIDRTNILSITMPSFGTTHRTRNNAEILTKEIGATFREIPIGDTVKSHFKDIGQDEKLLNTTFENAQARERTQVLMDVANMENGLVVGTGDLSELALGWATYNGDHMSMYSVNASIPKTLIREVVNGYALNSKNAVLKEVLLDILGTPVSPELLPGENGKIKQKTEDLIGPYELHDFFIYHCIKHRFSPSKLLFLAKIAFKNDFDVETIIKWMKNFYRRFFSQQFKRSCSPDGPKVTQISFSPRGGLSMPSDAECDMWMNEIDL